MSGINETAYPQLRADIAEKELLSLFTPTPLERRFIADAYRRATTLALIAIHLKVLQRLGYFVALANVPKAIAHHICKRFRIPPFTLDGQERWFANVGYGADCSIELINRIHVEPARSH